jgi:hypothetical protein
MTGPPSHAGRARRPVAASAAAPGKPVTGRRHSTGNRPPAWLADTQAPVSASSATAVRGSSIDSAPHSAKAPIAYGAAWTSAASKL